MEVKTTLDCDLCGCDQVPVVEYTGTTTCPLCEATYQYDEGVRLLEAKCTYCGNQYRGQCHQCRSLVQLHVLGLVSVLEEMVVETIHSPVEEHGIDAHLRNVWWLRDALNEYFTKDTTDENMRRLQKD